MALPQTPSLNRDAIHQLAGFTGIGWTASLLGYIAAMIGYGNGMISRLFVGPQSLLYLGLALFLTTVGLDQLAGRVSEH